VARRVTAKQGFTALSMLVYAFLYLPIVVMVIFAFNKPSPPALAAFHGSNICGIPPAQIGNITVWNGFTSCWFSAGLHDPTYLPAIVVSLQIAALASIISTLLGLGAALALASAARSCSTTCAWGTGAWSLGQSCGGGSRRWEEWRAWQGQQLKIPFQFDGPLPGTDEVRYTLRLG
jgi:ABC-type sugar transport system permease subunit